MTPEVQAIVDEVARNTTVDGSAVALINQIAGLLAQHAGNGPALLAALNELKGSSDVLAAAVTANTPAA